MRRSIMTSTLTWLLVCAVLVGATMSESSARDPGEAQHEKDAKIEQLTSQLKDHEAHVKGLPQDIKRLIKRHVEATTVIASQKKNKLAATASKQLDMGETSLRSLSTNFCGKDRDPRCPAWKGWCEGKRPWGDYTEEAIKSWMKINCAATCCKDPGAAARCQTTLPCVFGGDLSCPTTQAACQTRNGGWSGWKQGSEKGRSEYDAFLANATNPACARIWGGETISCPDGIGPAGVMMTSGMAGGKGGFSRDTRFNFCVPWSAVGTLMQRCDSSGGGSICTKAQVLHAHGSPRSVGTLILKRTRCAPGSKDCQVFKTGQCIDIGRDIWSHRESWVMRNMHQQAQAFGAAAQSCLVQLAAKDRCPKPMDELPCSCSPGDQKRSRELIISA